MNNNDPFAPPPHGIHQWLYRTACRLKDLSVTADNVIVYLYSREGECYRHYQPNEVEATVRNVYASEDSKRGGHKVKSVTFNPDWLATVAARVPEVDANYFKARSPLDVEKQTADSFMKALFYPGEKAICFNKYKSQGQLLWSHEGGGNTLKGWATDLIEGAWFLAQPVTGNYTQEERLVTPYNPTGRSRRCEECVIEFRYALLESDKADPALWLRALAQMPLPIASIVTSAGDSIHCLVRVNASTKQQWDYVAKGFLRYLAVPLGADEGALTAVRLTRLPFVHRGERLQELLYLDPDPMNTPIKTVTPIKNFPTLR
jgi:regulatory protein RepA